MGCAFPLPTTGSYVFVGAPDVPPRKEPTRSLRGLLAKYGAAPSAEEIHENRAGMFANFPSADF